MLSNNQLDTQYLGNSTVSQAALATGVKLKGYGNITNLDVAMSNDATLLNMVGSFKTLSPTTTWANLRNAADDWNEALDHRDGFSIGDDYAVSLRSANDYAIYGYGIHRVSA